MKLEDIKANIDSFFDNISDEEFFDLVTTRYNMPVVYEIDMPLAKPIVADDILPADIEEIDYKQTYSGDIPTNLIIRDESSQPLCEVTSNDLGCFSYSLSFAA